MITNTICMVKHIEICSWQVWLIFTQLTLYAFRSWQNDGEEIFLGLTNHHVFVGVQLIPGRLYRSAVTFCHQDGCFQVRILKYPTVS